MQYDTTEKHPEYSAMIMGPYFRPQAAAVYLGISISSFYNLVQQGLLPAPIKIGPRASCVPKVWLDRVMAERAAAK
jgi:predicted DNA-binding transcriptional regulator AlpA